MFRYNPKALGFFFALLLAGFSSLAAFSQDSLKIGSQVPAFNGTAIDGADFSADKLRGKVFVVTFWSTNCAICRAEIPKLNRFVDQFDPAKVVFLGLSNQTERLISSYLKENPFKFHILPSSFAAMLKFADRDKEGNLTLAYPAYYLVNQTGGIEYRANGFGKTDKLKSEISRLLVK